MKMDQVPSNHPAPLLQGDFFFYGKKLNSFVVDTREPLEGNVHETFPALSRGLENLLKGRVLPKKPHFGQ